MKIKRPSTPPDEEDEGRLLGSKHWNHGLSYYILIKDAVFAPVLSPPNHTFPSSGLLLQTLTRAKLPTVPVAELMEIVVAQSGAAAEGRRRGRRAGRALTWTAKERRRPRAPPLTRSARISLCLSAQR